MVRNNRRYQQTKERKRIRRKKKKKTTKNWRKEQKKETRHQFEFTFQVTVLFFIFSRFIVDSDLWIYVYINIISQLFLKINQTSTRSPFRQFNQSEICSFFFSSLSQPRAFEFCVFFFIFDTTLQRCNVSTPHPTI